jgi:hypothetical protein
MLRDSHVSKDSALVSVRARTRSLALLLFLVIASLGFIYPRLASTAILRLKPIEPQGRRVRQPPGRGGRGRRSSGGTLRPVPQRPRTDYSNFSHKTVAHQKSCDSCHKFPSANWKEVRQGDAAFADITDYPQHASCLECHGQQFFSGARPVICSVCHVNPSPRDSTRFPFPALGEPFYATKKAQGFVSDFRVNFPHAKHMDLIGQTQSPGSEEDDKAQLAGHRLKLKAREQSDKSCATCHETLMPQGKSDSEYVTTPPKTLGDAFWLKKGTFKTTPLGHANCFTCHSTDSGIGPAPMDCNTCHKLSTVATLPADFDSKLAPLMKVTDNLLLTKWRRRDSSGTFRHEGGAHPDTSCSVCHKVETMNTLEAGTLRVPVVSCGGCHVTATADDGGALNLEVEQRKANAAFQCTKCHVTFGRAPIPDSHLKALAAARSE